MKLFKSLMHCNNETTYPPIQTQALQVTSLSAFIMWTRGTFL